MVSSTDGLRSNRCISREEIRHRFGYHKAAIEGPNPSAETHACLRRVFVELADEINFLVPDSPGGREKDIALNYLETASMWFHKALARHGTLEPLFDEDDIKG